MDAIAKKARELGRAIADTPEYTEYKRYSEIINGDQHKKEVADRYAALLGRINDALAVQNVPVELKDEYEQCAREVNNDPDLVAFFRAQEEYLSMMNECVAIITDL